MNAPTTFGQALQVFDGQINKIATQLVQALPSHIDIGKFQRTLMAAVKADPDLLRADRASLINAVEKCALDGLLPDKREAALVVFKRNYKDAEGAWQQAMEVTYMPMVYGLRKKILQSGEIADIFATIVYRREVEEGAFLYEEGSERMLRHRPLMDLSGDDCTDDKIVAAYSMATYKDGSKSYEVMRRFQIDHVRESSQTGATKDKKGQPRKPSGPWVDHFAEQCKKTVMRRHSKTLPMSGDIIDVEGRELESGRSAAAMLAAVKPDAPIALPGRDEFDARALDDRSGTESGVALNTGQTIDGQTGEILPTDPATGLTEVDEETARALDAGEPEPEPQDDTAAIAEETAQAIDGPLDPHRGKPWAEKRRELLDRFANAEEGADLTAANKEFERHYVSFPEDIQAELNAAYSAARRRVRGEA